MPSTIAPDKTKSSRIPRAGQLIGVFVRAFEVRLNLSGAMAKAAERYFAGNDVVETNRKAIHEAIASAIANDIDLVPEEHSQLVRATLVDAMSVNEEAWNDLAALLDHQVAEHAELDLVAVLFTMLGTIDIALRVGAVRHILGVPLRTSVDEITWATSWALDEHPGILLSRWKDRSKLAVKDLHDIAPANTVHDWLHAGSRPAPEYQTALARRFAPALERPADEVRRMLHRHYALAAIAKRLRPHLGNTLGPIATKLEELALLVASFLADPRHTLSREQQLEAEARIATHGVAFKSCFYIVRALRRIEGDPVWRTALAASVVDWLRWLRLGIVHARTLCNSDARSEARDINALRQMMLAMIAMLDDEPSDAGDPRERAVLLQLRGDQFLALHEFADARRCFRAAIKLESNNPHVHYGLGCALWKPAFEYAPDRVPKTWRDDIEEAKRELWLAIELAANDGAAWGLPEAWDLPLVELGWILLESGLREEAIAHVAVIKARLGRHTALSAYFAGQVHEDRGAMSEAIRAYEESLRCDRRFQLAKESLTRCRRAQ